MYWDSRGDFTVSDQYSLPAISTERGDFHYDCPLHHVRLSVFLGFCIARKVGCIHKRRASSSSWVFPWPEGMVEKMLAGRAFYNDGAFHNWVSATSMARSRARALLTVS